MTTVLAQAARGCRLAPSRIAGCNARGCFLPLCPYSRRIVSRQVSSLRCVRVLPSRSSDLLRRRAVPRDALSPSPIISHRLVTVLPPSR